MARILPGFWVTLLLSALVLAPVLIRVNAEGPLTYPATLNIGPQSALEYLANNWALDVKQFVIGSVFADNIGGNAVNGSLWTLTHEALCYLGLVVLWCVRGLRPMTTLTLWFVIFAMQALDFVDHASFILASPALSLGAKYLFSALTRPLYLAFLSGVVLYHLRFHERASPLWLWIALIGFAASLFGGIAPIVWPITFPYLVITLVHWRQAWNFDRIGDWSYGVYLYAFPIQQCLVLTGLHHHGFTVFLLTSFAASLVAGAMSWHFVESPVLRFARSWAKPATVPANSAFFAKSETVSPAAH